jgi:hypothetical protein
MHHNDSRPLDKYFLLVQLRLKKQKQTYEFGKRSAFYVLGYTGYFAGRG